MLYSHVNSVFRISRLSVDVVLAKNVKRRDSLRPLPVSVSCYAPALCGKHIVCILTPEVKWACLVFTSQCRSKDEWVFGWCSLLMPAGANKAPPLQPCM